MVEVFIIRLHGRCLSERLMRPVVVVESLEFGQLDVQRAHAQLAVVELVELAAAGGVGALHAAVAIGASGRQHEQFDAALLAGGLELGHGLAAAVDLHRLDIERRLADQAVEECRGAGGGGARDAADGAVPALDERHARSVRGGRAAEAKVRPAGARARLPAGRRHPVAGRLHLPGAGDQLLPAERLAGGPLMQPPGRRLRKPHPRASQRLRRGASPVQRLRCQRAAFRAVHARLQPVRADAPRAGRELRVDAHRDLSPAALLQGGQDRAPCQGPGLEAVRRARGAAA